MNLLSPEVEKELVDRLVEQCTEKLLSVIEQNYHQFPYVQQNELMNEMNISYPYLKKLESRGLKRVKLDSKDKTIFYKRRDVVELMDKLAE